MNTVPVTTIWTCPVCGNYLAYPPKDYHICPCCGTEFYNDDSEHTHEELREEWLKTGPKWWSDFTSQPENWNWEEQVLRVMTKPKP